MPVGQDAHRLRLAFSDPWDLCEKLGLLHGRKGRSYQPLSKGVLVQCPVHQDRTPSCSVTQGKDGSVQVKCFGCDLSGSALDLIAAVEGLQLRGHDFVRVLQKAQLLCNEQSNSSLSYTRSYDAANLPVDDGVHDKIACILRDEAPVFKQQDTVNFLSERGVLDHGASTWFAIPQGKYERIKLCNKIVEVIGIDAWLCSGLAYTRADGVNDWLFPQHRLVIPWCAENGSVDVLQRRSLESVEAVRGIGKYVLPRGRSPRWPFGWADALEHLQPSTAIAFVEGAIDVLSFNALSKMYGLNAVAVGLPGLEGWRRSWASLAKDRLAIIGFDRDRAGDLASRQVYDDLLQAGALRIENRQPKAPSKDWNDAWRTAQR